MKKLFFDENPWVVGGLVLRPPTILNLEKRNQDCILQEHVKNG